MRARPRPGLHGCSGALLTSGAMPRTPMKNRKREICTSGSVRLTTRVTKTFAVIGIEDLDVRGMLRNRRLARSIADGGFYELRRQIDYKARLYGARVIVADRWYPSSKTCSCCGVIKETLAL